MSISANFNPGSCSAGEASAVWGIGTCPYCKGDVAYACKDDADCVLFGPDLAQPPCGHLAFAHGCLWQGGLDTTFTWLHPTAKKARHGLLDEYLLDFCTSPDEREPAVAPPSPFVLDGRRVEVGTDSALDSGCLFAVCPDQFIVGFLASLQAR